MNRICSKENPRNVDKIKSYQPSKEFIKMPIRLMPKPMKNYSNTMQNSPNDKSPTSTMPNTTQEKSKEKINTRSWQGTTTST